MVRIDELSPFLDSEASLDSDALVHPVRKYIDETLDGATDSVRMAAPLHRLDTKALTGSLQPVSLNSEITYYTLALPDDFLRIANIRMSNWERSCTQAVTNGGEAYRLLRNPHTTAGSTKPAVVVAGSILELYGSRITGATLQDKEYIHRWRFTETDIAVDLLALEAIYWRCAVEVLSIMGRAEAAKQAEQFAMGSLQ
jgi:hypothetical protein